MTITEMVVFLEPGYELCGGIGKPKKGNIRVPGYGLFPGLDWSVCITGDGIIRAIRFTVKPEYVDSDEEAEDILKRIGNDHGLAAECVRKVIGAYLNAGTSCD